ncbi:cohesin domain-containing protein, partial [Candidatus Bathyarchaeota archaeon]|nr:cohesin domain-containing protein [Candidatus Bathyarchaeota archaeon]
MTRKKAVVSNLILVLLLIQTFASFSTAQASGTGISINPSSLTASMGDNITITVTAGNVTNLYGWQAAIKYSASIINCTGVWLPVDNVFAGLSQIPVPPILNDPTNDGLNYALWGVSLLSGAVSFVQGTLFKMNFTVVGYGETVIQIGTIQNPIQYNPSFPQTWYTYLQDPDLNEIPFTEENGTAVVRATKAQVAFTQTGVGSEFAGAVVSIDEVNYTRTGMPLSFTWDIGSNHSFAYQSPLVVSANAKRYVWNSTSGPLPLPSGTINVTAPQTVTGNYETQYYLTVNSTYDSPNPTSGWYEENASIATSVTSVVSGPTGTRYVCTGWTGTGSVPSSGGNSSFSFVINQSSSIAWNWKTQYLLTVSTSPDGLNPQPSKNPTGEAASANSWWYDDAIGVTLSAETVDGYTFTHRSIDGASQGSGTNPVSAIMNVPQTATAYYTSNGTVPDIAVVNLTSSKTIVVQGYTVVINVSVEN